MSNSRLLQMGNDDVFANPLLMFYDGGVGGGGGDKGGVSPGTHI